MFRWPRDQHRYRLYWWAIAAIGTLPIAAVLGLTAFLVISGGVSLRDLRIESFLATTWLPLDNRFGLWPLLLGTVVSTGLALLIAMPLGIATALYLTLHAPRRIRILIDSVVALLGSLPSVVVGLWGMTWVVPLAGNTLTSAILVLALMITPTFTLLAGTAIRLVPADLVETSRALGVSEDVPAGVVLRHAVWGVLGAAILAATRGLGEAVAVSMVAGNVGLLPALDGPISTLATTLIVELDGATGQHRSALYACALLVMIIAAAVSLAGRALQERRA